MKNRIAKAVPMAKMRKGGNLMKNRIAKTVPVTLALVLMLTMAVGCLVPVRAITITVTPETATIDINETQQFTATVSPEGANQSIIWAVNDPAIGSIDQAGVFTSIAVGTITITATHGEIKGTATVTVALPVLEGINISDAEVVVGKTHTFTPSPYPAGAEIGVITWTVEDEAIGTIDEAGVFTAIAVGTTTITATHGEIRGTATVTVIEPDVAPVVEITSPIDGAILSAVLNITGTAYDANLRDYRVYVTPIDDWMWKLGCYGRWRRGIGLIELSTNSVSDGVLGVFDTTNFPDGKFLLRLRATDTEDNRAAIDPISITIDNNVVDDVPPDAEITLPVEGETVSGISSIKGTVNDDNLWRYRIRAVSTDGWWRACAGCGDASVIDGQLATWDTSRIPDGNYTLRVYAADFGGNVYVALRNIAVDNVVDDVMPVAELTAPTDGQTVSGTVYIMGSASDENIWMYVIWTFDADGIRRHAGFARGTSVTEGVLSTWDSTTFTDGEYLVELHVTDWGGNTKIVSVNVTIDNIVEDSITMDPISATLNITDTQQFTATVGPEGADQNVRWSVDNETVGTIDENGLFTALAEGLVTVTATSVANPNLTGTATVTVIRTCNCNNGCG